MAAIQLDVVVNAGETIEQVNAELTAGTSVTARVIAQTGPAGGNPLVEFEGSEDELALVEQRYDSPATH